MPGDPPTERFPTVASARYRDPVLLAAGGMGVVYRAHDSELGRDVAIKLLGPSVTDREEFRRRFAREAMAAARISHPHVVTVYDVGEHEGKPYLVMEYVPGGTLADRLADGPPEQAQALEWIDDVASALDAAHARGVVHRDVKPANLLVDAENRVKVADFGIARALEAGQTTLTAPGTMLGTTGYLAPEQIEGGPTGPATDVYSLAAVAFELLTGRRPFGGRPASAELGAHLYEPVPSASSGDLRLPGAVDAVLARGMAKSPGDRHPSAHAFADALAAALAAAPRRGPAMASAPRRGRGARLAVAAVVVALLAAGGIALATTMGGGEPDQAATPAAPTPDAAAQDPVPAPAEDAPAEPEPEPEVAPEPAPAPDPEPAPPAPAPAPELTQDEAVALVDDSTAAISGGDPDTGLALAVQALEALDGTGAAYEGNAEYNAGRSLIDLDRCDEAVPYLEASAGTGSSSQNAIRADALSEARGCASGSTADEASSTAPPAPPAPAGPAARSRSGAVALTDRSTAAISRSDPVQGLALAQRALGFLEGTGDPYEGNARYNAGRSLIDLDRCDEAAPLLAASAGTGSAPQNRIRRAALAEARAC